MPQSCGWNLQRLQHSRNNSDTNHGTDRDDKVSVATDKLCHRRRRSDSGADCRTDLYGAHHAAGEGRQSTGDLRHALTNALADLRQVGPSERRRRRRRRRRRPAGTTEELLAGDARAAFKLVEARTRLVLAQ